MGRIDVEVSKGIAWAKSGEKWMMMEKIFELK